MKKSNKDKKSKGILKRQSLKKSDKEHKQRNQETDRADLYNRVPTIESIRNRGTILSNAEKNRNNTISIEAARRRVTAMNNANSGSLKQEYERQQKRTSLNRKRTNEKSLNKQKISKIDKRTLKNEVKRERVKQASNNTSRRNNSSNSYAPKKMNYKMVGRMKVVFFIVSIILCFLAGMVLYINKENGERYTKKVLSQQSYVSSIIPYKRGTITDRRGIVLAQSYKVYNVILDPKVLLTTKSNVKVTLTALSEIFELDYNELNKILNEKSESSYVILKKHQTYELMEEFEKRAEEQKELSKTERIKGVWFEEEYIRTYPYDSLASHIIGYTSAGNVGTWGVEQYYNDYLNGINGRTYGYYDSELNLKRTVKNASDGNNIVTTIDVNIQTIVERKIKDFKEKTKCKNLGVIVMNPNNGEIYSMASNEGFNLNDPYNLSNYYTEEEISAMTEEETLNILNGIWRNFCISDTYEPGSTFKPFTVAAAFEEDLVTKEETFVCSGSKTSGTWKINCNNTHGTLTVAEGIMKSCNPVMMELARRIGSETFYNYELHFGLGKKTGIDLPGEAEGILISRDNLNMTELDTSSFGQGSNVTMIQIAAGMSALINGGHYYKPHVVKEITDSNNVTIFTADANPVDEIISTSTSEFIREALYMTVEKGTAKAGQIEGYAIGGKTGTAQKLPRYKDKTKQKYIVSFIGAAPMDDPEVVVFVVIDEIEDQNLKDKSSNATKIAAEILEEILPYLGIYPEGDIKYKVDLPQAMVDTAGTTPSGNGNGSEGSNGDNKPVYNSDYDESVSNFLPPTADDEDDNSNNNGDNNDPAQGTQT